LLLIDLDLFKEVNDTMGHDAGDALLVEVAKRLVATMREADCVARLGGDEFAVLLAESDVPSDLDATCRRILGALAEPFLADGHSLNISASIGAARCPGHASDSDALYKCADLALYETKRAGRNSWSLYDPLGYLASVAHPNGLRPELESAK
jgi:diguanylate cyclase (GGDEF)-like protein